MAGSRLNLGGGTHLCGSAILVQWEADWFQISAVNLTCCVTLDKCLNFSGSQFSSLC